MEAIKGPFVRPPISELNVNPMLTREKQDSDSRRVIVDMSWPHGNSVNFNVAKEVFWVHRLN